MDAEEKMEARKLSLEQWAERYTDEILKALYGSHQEFTADEALDFVFDYQSSHNERIFIETMGAKGAVHKVKANLIMWMLQKIFGPQAINEMSKGIEKRYAVISLKDNIDKTHNSDKRRAIDIIKGMNHNEKIAMLKEVLDKDLRNELMEALTAKT